jgi:hypothetical protein
MSVDQPVQVGFSYDQLVASTLDLLSGAITPINGSFDALRTNATFVKGILTNQKFQTTANTSANAAKILWVFTQVCLQDFPEHQCSDSRFSL